MSTTVERTFLDTPLRDVPGAIATAVSDWTSLASDWIVEHKQELLTVLKVIAFVAAIVGLGVMLASLANPLFTATSHQTFAYLPGQVGGWHTVSAVSLNSQFMTGAVLASGGAMAYDMAQ